MPPDQPEPLPDVRASITPPPKELIDTWTLAWTAVRFRTRGVWKIGVVKGKIRLTDGTWILEIEHAHDGLHSGWTDKIFVAWDPRIIRPIEAEPPTAEPDR